MRYPFLKGAVGEILRSAMGLDCAIQKGINNDRTTTQGADLQRTSERLDTVEKKAKGTSPTPSHPVPPLPVLLRQKLDQTRALGIEVDAPPQSSDRSNRWKYACPKCEATSADLVPTRRLLLPSPSCLRPGPTGRTRYRRHRHDAGQKPLLLVVPLLLPASAKRRKAQADRPFPLMDTALNFLVFYKQSTTPPQKNNRPQNGNTGHA